MSGHHHHHHHEGHGHQHDVHGGAPVIDIGDDIGALVVFMDDADAGTELFLRPDDVCPGEPARTVHSGVWPRQHRGGQVTAAVFGELVEDSYWVLDADGSDRFSVQIRGGELTQIDMRTEDRASA